MDIFSKIFPEPADDFPVEGCGGWCFSSLEGSIRTKEVCGGVSNIDEGWVVCEESIFSSNVACSRISLY